MPVKPTAAALAALLALAAGTAAHAATISSACGPLQAGEFCIPVDTPDGVLGRDAGGGIFTLANGVAYTITVRGAVNYARNGQLYADAQYWGFYEADLSGWREVKDRFEPNGPDGPFDIGVTLDGVRVDWGPFNLDSTYSAVFTGKGAPVRLAFLDAPGAYGDNDMSTLRASISGNGAGPTIAPNPIPLPAGLPLLAAGLGALALLRRRRR